MTTIRFTTEIGSDGTIHLPQNATVHPGLVEVIVFQEKSESALQERQADDTESAKLDQPFMVAELLRRAREIGSTNLPSDYAFNHDHYLHGAPKK